MTCTLLLLATVAYGDVKLDRLPWDLAPEVLKDTLVQVETSAAQPVRGLFHACEGDVLKIATGQAIQDIPRAEIKSLQVYKEIPARRLRAVAKSYGKRVNQSGDLIFNRQRPIGGFILLGVSTVRRGIALPFAALGDLLVEVDWSRPSERFTIAPPNTPSPRRRHAA